MAIDQAKAGRETRRLEGADASELKRREDEIAAMQIELDRTKRVVADAAPIAMPQLPAGLPSIQVAAAAAMPTPAAVSRPIGLDQDGQKVQELLTKIEANTSATARQLRQGVAARFS